MNFKSLLNNGTQINKSVGSNNQSNHGRAANTLTIHGINCKRLEDGRLCLDESQDEGTVRDILFSIYNKKVEQSYIKIDRPGLYVQSRVNSTAGPSLRVLDTVKLIGTDLYTTSFTTGEVKKFLVKYMVDYKLLGYDIYNNTDKVIFGIEPKQSSYVSIVDLYKLHKEVDDNKVYTINFRFNSTDTGLKVNDFIPEKVIKVELEKSLKIRLMAQIKYRDKVIGYFVHCSGDKSTCARCKLDREIYCADGSIKKVKQTDDVILTHNSNVILTAKELKGLIENPSANCKVIYENFELGKAYGNSYVHIKNNLDSIDLLNSYSEFNEYIKHTNSGLVNRQMRYILNQVLGDIRAFGGELHRKYYES